MIAAGKTSLPEPVAYEFSPLMRNASVTGVEGIRRFSNSISPLSMTMISLIKGLSFSSGIKFVTTMALACGRFGQYYKNKDTKPSPTGVN